MITHTLEAPFAQKFYTAFYVITKNETIEDVLESYRKKYKCEPKECWVFGSNVWVRLPDEWMKNG